MLTIIDNTTYYIDTEVVEDITYYYVISAINEAGEGPHSNEINITTSIAPKIDNADSYQLVFLLILIISIVITTIMAYIIWTEKSTK